MTFVMIWRYIHKIDPIWGSKDRGSRTLNRFVKPLAAGVLTRITTGIMTGVLCLFSSRWWRSAAVWPAVVGLRRRGDAGSSAAFVLPPKSVSLSPVLRTWTHLSSANLVDVTAAAPQPQCARWVLVSTVWKNNLLWFYWDSTLTRESIVSYTFTDTFTFYMSTDTWTDFCSSTDSSTSLRSSLAFISYSLTGSSSVFASNTSADITFNLYFNSSNFCHRSIVNSIFNSF